LVHAPSCPYCHEAMEGPARAPGDVVDCPGCDRSFVVPGATAHVGDPEEASIPGDDPLGSSFAFGSREAARRARVSDVSLTRTGGAALAVAVVFYVAVVWPLSESYFGQLFGDRGWVPYVITFFSIWSGLLLATKYRRLSRHRRVLDLDLLPPSIARSITPESAPAFLSYLRSLPPEYLDNFLVERVRRALEHFCARPRVTKILSSRATRW